ncbi:peptidase M16 [Alteromonadaceae bacterium M269]|nr:peptidase M16 [Alteromonadaceae bacterium M269]
MTVIVSSYDKRRYFPSRLDSGLEVLLVEDDSINKSAVSLTVASGHFHDPDNCHGLAHLLEHMIFMGSGAFPSPNHLNDFLSHHGGHINAWTGTEHANYYFDCETKTLEEAISIFSDMIQHPLLDTAAIEKESQSIHAEFELKLKDDLRRLYQVHKETCNPNHPFSKFSVGNQQIFNQFSSEDLSDLLREFHQQWYNVQHFKLCVISDLPHTQTKALLEQSFNSFHRETQLPKLAFPPLYLPEQLGVQINIKPIKHAKRLIITFVYPGVHKHYRSKPLDFISSLIGDEGPGSLLYYLKKQGWATNLSAGGGIDGENFKDFNINLQLTTKGLKHKVDILASLFNYISLIKTTGLEKWRIEEKSKLNQQAFDFRDSEKPLDYAMHLSTAMHHYPIEHIVFGDYILDKPDLLLVNAMLELMTPDNMRLKFIHDELTTNQVANWYGTEFKIEALAEDIKQVLNRPEFISDLQLPQKNPFVAERLTPHIVEPSYTSLKQLKEKESFKFWFGQDSDFKLPKGDLYISFESPDKQFLPETVVLRSLWVAICQEQFHQHFYQASTAGLGGYVYSHQGGFSIHTHGFTDKQLSLAKHLFEHIHTNKVDTELFEQIKAKQVQKLKNNLLNKPLNLLFSRLSVLLQRNTFSSDDKLPILNSVSEGDIQQFQESTTSSYQIEAALLGDWKAEEANDFSQWLYDEVKANLCRGKKVSREVTDLRDSAGFVLDIPCTHNEAALVTYFQAPSEGPKDTALSMLTEQLLSAPFFNYMRTEKQLGYLVGSGYFPFNQHPGIAFYVQSPNANVDRLYQEMMGCLKQFSSELQNFPETQWQSMKRSVINQLSDKDANLSIKAQRLWIAIGNNDIQCLRRQKLIDALKNITLNCISQYCEAMLNGVNVGRICLYCSGKNNPKPSIPGYKVNDIYDFKSSANFIQ